MKTILCYGDSNTHGFDPVTGGRYVYDERWPGILQQTLGRDAYMVIEEGLNSRTTVCEDCCYDDNKSGLALLPAILKSHFPLDLLIIMLGSNDMKQRFHMEPAEIARGAASADCTAGVCIQKDENRDSAHCTAAYYRRSAGRCLLL